MAAVDELEDLARLYVHEALRLFEDRLVYAEEKVWCNETLDEVAKRWFTGMDEEKALKRPILFSNFTNREYISVKQEDLKIYIEGRLKTFYEEELNVQLVVLDSVIDHILRIDRVLKMPLGHALLVGASGVGKTTLTRFVSWLNNLSVFQIKAGRNYSVAEFDDDLRSVMRRAGCKSEKICFIFDESNVLGPAFLERMNALLAAGEVPGLFDGEDYATLISECRAAAGRDGNMIDTEEELYKMFVYNVQRNLHVVFTMNPSNPDFANRTASSPALFNRCVIDWFGDWTDDGLIQVAQALTETIEVPDASFTKPVGFDEAPEYGVVAVDPKNALLAETIVNMHKAVRELNVSLMKSAKKFNYITPRDFLDFIKHFLDLKAKK
jgi:dynein heavy chain 1